MRHVGILAHSVEGAALCFRSLCHIGFAEIGPDDHPDVTLDCIALARSMPGWNSGDHGTIRDILALSVRRLAAAGAEFFVCADNTAHQALELTGTRFALPGLHIADEVAAEAAKHGYRRVGVLGTKYLMEGPVYPTALAALGLEAEIPGPDDRDLVNHVIFTELLYGKVTNASRQVLLRIINDLRTRGCDAIALVCTELPLLITPESSSLPTLNSTELLARAAFDVAVGARPLPGWRGGPVRAS